MTEILEAYLHSEWMADKDRVTKKFFERKWRFMTLQEVLKIGSGTRVYVQLKNGNVAQAKVTSVKTWKSRPRNATVNVKYGLREYAEYNMAEATWIHGVLYVEVNSDGS